MLDHHEAASIHDINERLHAHLQTLKTAALAREPELLECSAIALRGALAELSQAEKMAISLTFRDNSTSLGRLFSATKKVVDKTAGWHASENRFNDPSLTGTVFVRSDVRG